MTLEEWNTFLQLLSAVLLGLTFIVGSLTIITGIKVNKRLAERIALAQRESAEANSSAAEAGAGAARALGEAASANERAVKLEVEAAQQRERAAKAEKDLLELQQRLAWRTVSGEQRSIISRTLAPYRGQRLVLFVIAGSEEVDRFARQLEGAFEATGIIVDVTRAGVVGVARSGIFIEVGVNRISFARAIDGALISAGIIDRPLRVRESSDPDALTLEIWPKGQ